MSFHTKRLKKAKKMASKQKKTVYKMLTMLLRDLRDLEHRGAGYFSAVPYADRYNKLLGLIRSIYPEDAGVLGTFEEMKPTSSTDPADKVKAIEKLIVETGQLIAFIEASFEEGSGEEGKD